VEGAFEESDHAERMKDEGGGMKGKDARQVFRDFILRPSCFILFFALALCSRAGGVADEKSWRVWLEPKSSRAPVTLPIAGAERTVLCAGFLEEDGLRPLTRAEQAAMGIGMDRFAVRALENANSDLKGLQPRYERNRKRVIEYAELQSDRPIVTSAVLGLKFRQLFKDTLGEKVLVAVPNRFTAFVFPALASRYEDYGPMVRAALGTTAWPVSIEVFEVSAAGVRCVGRYAEP
jgi:hypothetical protein